MRITHRLELAEHSHTHAVFPRDGPAYYNWGVSSSGLGREDEVIEKYNLAVELDPQDAYTHFNWGVILANLSHYDEAEEHFWKVIHLESRLVEKIEPTLKGLEAQRPIERQHRLGIRGWDRGVVKTDN